MSFYRRIANLFSRSSVEREIEAELQAHIAMRTEDNITAGMTPEDSETRCACSIRQPYRH